MCEKADPDIRHSAFGVQRKGELIMAKDYAGIAKTVLKLVGGEENVAHLEHCSTRLRFSIADAGKVDKDGLKATSGVMGVIASGNQCQVVIGNDVVEVYEELVKPGKFDGGNVAPAAGAKKDIGAVVLDFLVGVFQPLVPAIAGAGILKAMLSLFTLANIMQATDAWYIVLYNAADALFTSCSYGGGYDGHKTELQSSGSSCFSRCNDLAGNDVCC